MTNTKPLTSKRQAMFDFIRSFIAREHYSPSYEEIRVGCGMSTKSLVQYHLRKLEQAGHITQVHSKTRTIQMVIHD